ncbi:uncharacterized protein LOC114359555 isoform X2 [Ostrinia furnacalis]|uniref:uncharacterized protein LOC114359555 isoform X2 n=1 Tax=Ostrinia furnacalis TaxID=93504 RepID=UPI001038D8A7|nr:uncharacterized protein LOC114359555 isoform X2 [Ostrinia furnacalis]
MLCQVDPKCSVRSGGMASIVPDSASVYKDVTSSSLCNMQLANMATQRLRARYLCVDHFDQKHVRNHKGARTTLLRHAIPEHYQNQSLPGEKKHTEDTIPFIFFCVSCATYVCDTWQDELHQRHYVVRGPRGCPMVCK